MAPKVDRRLEGLKELAAMIAEAYYRQITRKAGADVIRNNPEEPENDSGIKVLVQCNDPSYGGLYTETVKVENFLRNLKSRARKAGLRAI